MTVLVSLRFITMIPIDCKLHILLIVNYIFSLIATCLITFYNIGELTNATSKGRMTTSIIFTDATPIN